MPEANVLYVTYYHEEGFTHLLEAFHSRKEAKKAIKHYPDELGGNYKVEEVPIIK